MRTILAVLVLGLATFGSGGASAEVVYPWCAHYGGKGGGTNCGFSSFAQCEAARSGNGGYCGNNTLYAATAGTAVAVQRHKRRYHRHDH